MFLSDSHSDGTHSLQSSIAETKLMQRYSSPNLMKNKLGLDEGESISRKYYNRFKSGLSIFP